MLTIGELLQLSDPRVIRQASKYRVDLFRTIEKDNKRMIIGVVLGGEKPQKSSIQVTDKKTSISSRALVYCSCAYFVHNLEISLAARGSAKVLNAKELMPNKKNPKFQPGLCPHLVFLAKLALSADTTQKQAEQRSVKISNKLKKL